MDIGDVIDDAGTLAYRLVALGRDANSSIDGIPDDRLYVAPSFTGYEDQLFRSSGVINGTLISRYYQLRDYDSDNYAIDNRLVGKFSTEALDHTLLFGHGAVSRSCGT